MGRLGFSTKGFRRLPKMDVTEANANKIINSTLESLWRRQFQSLSEKSFAKRFKPNKKW